MKIKNNIALSDSGFLFNPSSGDSFSVNEIGKTIIKMFQEGKSDDEISKAILKEYLIDENAFEKDFYDFKKMLESHKLTE